MANYYLHVGMSVLTAVGLLAIAGVMYQRFGLDLYSVGFAGLGLLTLYRSIPPLVFPDRFDRSRVSRQQLLFDIVGVIFVGVALYLFVVERAAFSDYISL